MMKKGRSVFLWVLLLLLLAGGCSRFFPEPPVDLVPRGYEEELLDQAPQRFLAESSRENIENFSQALFREALTQEEKNPLISPLSAYFALGMVSLGAREDSRGAFRAVLAAEPANLAVDLHDFAQRLASSTSGLDLNQANSLWLSNTHSLDPYFAHLMQRYFHTQAQVLDFTLEESLEKINAWAYEQSQGQIETMLASLDPDETMLVLSALYFHADWPGVFSTAAVEVASFHSESGGEVELSFVRVKKGDFPSFQREGEEGVLLLCEAAGQGLFLVRPTGETPLREWAAELDFIELFRSLGQKPSREVVFPRLDVEFEFDLREPLIALGLSATFDTIVDPSEEQIEKTQPLPVFQIRQRLRFVVGESGEESATPVFGQDTQEVSNLAQMRFDTPFWYALVDLESGLPILMGLFEGG